MYHNTTKRWSCSNYFSFLSFLTFSVGVLFRLREKDTPAVLLVVGTHSLSLYNRLNERFSSSPLHCVWPFPFTDSHTSIHTLITDEYTQTALYELTATHLQPHMLLFTVMHTHTTIKTVKNGGIYSPVMGAAATREKVRHDL